MFWVLQPYAEVPFVEAAAHGVRARHARMARVGSNIQHGCCTRPAVRAYVVQEGSSRTATLKRMTVALKSKPWRKR
eukprot:SAG31_NODE_29594_length_392_cov_2.238908_1_plen_75_part_10